MKFNNYIKWILKILSIVSAYLVESDCHVMLQHILKY